MPRETQLEKKARAGAILTVLKGTYPDAHCELNFRNPLELLIATILSAQTTDKQVNATTSTLFEKYRTAEDYAKADLAVLQEDLKSIGLFRNKAKNIQACCRALADRFGGEVPASMEALLGLRGVGRKTANVVLGNAFQAASGIVVDTHVARLSRRLGLTREENAEKVELDLQGLIPEKHWILFSHWLIWHGRRRCGARKPDCENCEIRTLCPSSGARLGPGGI